MRFVFMGSPAEVIAPLEALLRYCDVDHHQILGVVSQAAKPVGRKLQLQDPPVAAFAKARGLSVWQPPNINDPLFLESFAALMPDVVITAAYGQMLSSAFLAIPARATINIHPSLLPAYRGATPVPQALLDGCTETGTTVLFTVKAMDAGAIIVQSRSAIAPSETQAELTARLFLESGDLLTAALDKLQEPGFVGTAQDEARVSRCRKIKKEDGAIRWQDPSEQIWRRYRAFKPWPGSFSSLGGKRLNLSVIEPLRDSLVDIKLSPGEFTAHKTLGGLLVGTGTSPLLIKRLIPEGGREMEALAFANGLKAEQERRLG